MGILVERLAGKWVRSVGANCVEDSGGAIFGTFVGVTVGWIVGSSVGCDVGSDEHSHGFASRSALDRSYHSAAIA